MLDYHASIFRMEPVEEPPIICLKCHGEFGDNIFFVDFEWRCGECFDRWFYALTREQVADEMGIPHTDSEDGRLFLVENEWVSDEDFDEFLNNMTREEKAVAMQVNYISYEELEDEY